MIQTMTASQQGLWTKMYPEMYVATEYLGRKKKLSLISKHLLNVYCSQGTEAITLKPSNGFIFS